MSSSDDDAFNNFLIQQKSKIKSKYVEEAEVKNLCRSMDSFILDDSDISEYDSHSDLEKKVLQKTFNHNSPIFSSDDDSYGNESDYKKNKMTDEYPNVKNIKLPEFKGGIFSEDKLPELLLRLDYRSNSDFEKKGLQKSCNNNSPVFSSEDHSSGNDESDYKKKNSIDDMTVLEQFKTPFVPNCKKESKNNNKCLESLHDNSVRELYQIKNLDYLKKNEKFGKYKSTLNLNLNNKENSFVTPIIKKKNLDILAKTAPLKKIDKTGSTFKRLKVLSSSDSFNNSDSEEICDDGDDSPDSFIDNSKIEGSSDDLFSDISDDSDYLNKAKLCTPKNNKKIIDKRLVQTVPCKGYIEKLDFITSLLDSVDDKIRHADAVLYRKNFKLKKEELALKIYEICNEKVFMNKMPKNIEIIWKSKLRKTAGQCLLYRKSTERMIKISLSVKVITSCDRLLKTLIHEMCHGAVWMINKEKDNHGPLWKFWTGMAHKSFPMVPISERCHSYKIHYKFEYWCHACNAAVKRHSKSLGPRKVCGRCKGKFTLYRITAKGEKVLVDNTQPLTGFSAFVKANYSKYRSVDTAHIKVMKKLSEEYKSTKASSELTNMLENMNLTEKQN